MRQMERNILLRFVFIYPFSCEQYCINLLSASLIIFHKNSVQHLKQTFFFHQDFLSRKLTIHTTAAEGMEVSFIQLPPAHEHSDIYLQLCMWNDYYIFLIASLVFTTTRWDLPHYRITIWLIDDVTLSFCLFAWWFDSGFFCCSNLRPETGGFELASTITLVLQANRLTKCPSHTTSEPTNQVCYSL